MDFAQAKAECAERAESMASQIILLKSVLLPRTRDKTLDRHELISHIQLPNHRFIRSLKINRVSAAMINTVHTKSRHNDEFEKATGERQSKRCLHRNQCRDWCFD